MKKPLEPSQNMVCILWDGDDSPSLVPIEDLELIEQVPNMTTASEQIEKVDTTLLVDESSSVQQRLVVLAEDTRARMKRSARDIYHIGANLLEAQNLLAHGEFLGWIKVEFDMSKSAAYRFMDVARAFQDKLPILGNLEIAASALYFLASPNTPEPAREEALELAAGGQVVSTSIAKEIVGKHKKPAALADLVTEKGESLGLPTQGDSVLPESDYIDELRHASVADVDDRPGALPKGASAVDAASIEEIHMEDGRKLFISHSPGVKLFNPTNDMVDWARWTWNPVTGCWHFCDYCFARDIANRFYETKFEPTFHPDRLSAPANTRVPGAADTDTRAKNVFVCSMADLFGKWVPEHWILQVFEQVIDNPQWNFLFLTKFPQRLQEICDKLGGFPDNAWVGTTVDTQARVKVAEKAFKNISAKVKWLSCEPMLERLTFDSLEMFDWVVIGGQSKSTKTPEFQPQIEWVSDLFLQARVAGCKVYRKENLIVDFPKELPW